MILALSILTAGVLLAVFGIGVGLFFLAHRDADALQLRDPEIR